MRLSLIALGGLLPLISALHFPSPQDALSAADSFLHPGQSGQVRAGQPAGVTLGYANDITLAQVPGDEHVVLTSSRHPVRLQRLFQVDIENRRPELTVEPPSPHQVDRRMVRSQRQVVHWLPRRGRWQGPVLLLLRVSLEPERRPRVDVDQR